VARATAEHSLALDHGIAALPAFLRQLEPTMARLDALAGQTTPLLGNLHAAAPGVDRAVTHLASFARSANGFVHSLGDTTVSGTPAVRAALPLVQRLGRVGANAQPFGAKLGALLTSLRSTGGLERLLDFIFLTASATNGYDSLGHYLRSVLVVNACSTYATAPTSGCSASLGQGAASRAKPAALLNYLLGPR
jgi:hypothetical protein